MRYYIDLATLGFWIAMFIHYLRTPDSSVIAALIPWALLYCILGAVGKMLDHDIERYIQKRHTEQLPEETEKEDE